MSRKVKGKTNDFLAQEVAAEEKRLSELKVLSKDERAQKQAMMIAEALRALEIADEKNAYSSFRYWTNIERLSASPGTPIHPGIVVTDLSEKQQWFYGLRDINAKWIAGFIEHVKSFGYTASVTGKTIMVEY